MIESIRRNVRRSVRDDGRVVETAVTDRIPLFGTIGEVESLNPPRVEVLSGPSIKPDAFVGPLPAVGDVVLVIEVGRYRLAVTGIRVI